MRIALVMLGTVWGGVAVALGGPSLGGEGPLWELKAYRTLRVGSSDPTGGNRDWWVIGPGETRVLADLEGPGEIVHFRDNVTCVRTPYHLRRMVIRIWWDGEETPSVECPMGDFFAIPFGLTRAIRSAAVTIPTRPRPEPGPAESGAARNMYWPMPFRKSARITLTNETRSVSKHWWEITYKRLDRPLPPDTATFHAQYRQAKPAPAGQPYTILEARGRGHYVGTVLGVVNRGGGWWGEGDDLVYVDGEKTPSLNGTGSEDYFCDSYGVREVTTPYFGCTVIWGKLVGCYRWHIPDPIPFRRSIVFRIEHGKNSSNNRGPNEYSSAAFWYQVEPHAPFPPLPPPEARIPGAAEKGEP